MAGQMGDNLPVVDLGTGRTATVINAGPSHTCAILDNGDTKCWGNNNAGQLGRGDTTNRGDMAGQMGDNLPAVDLGTGRTATAVNAGYRHTCAVLDNGDTKCWGFNRTGELGLGDATNRGGMAGQMGDNLPAVDLGTGRKAVSMVLSSDASSCALLDDETVKCWGYNGFGQLGQGDRTDRGSVANDMGDNLSAIDLGGRVRPVQVDCVTSPSHGFGDVPAGSYANTDITCIKALAITTGTSNTTYSPADTVTREQMGAFLGRHWRALDGTCAATPAHGFTDVPASSYANADITCIKALGITTGSGNGTIYSPYNPVTREQMAAFLGRLIRANINAT